jgi:hypothetical protein
MPMLTRMSRAIMLERRMPTLPRSAETTPVTGTTITNAQIQRVRDAILGVPRKNAHHRAILTDSGPALSGNSTCRESLADTYNELLGLDADEDPTFPTPDQEPPAHAVDDPVIKDSWATGLVTCAYCERGFRRVDGIHIGSQRLGMIADVPCDRVFATHGGSMTEDNKRPWMAFVDGGSLRKQSGDARRFSSAKAAYAAARKAAPKRWHS